MVLEWQKFIALKGYKPRASISQAEAQKAGLTKAEQTEETRLGQWANHTNNRLSVLTEQQRVEFNRLRRETLTYFRKNQLSQLQ